MKYRPLLDYMSERHRIYLRRKIGGEKPWTEDHILQNYRFCNVYRELDTVTEWVRVNIRERFEEHPELWFMICIARQINWPDTIAELIADKKGAWPHKRTWDWERARNVMLDRQATGAKLYTGAYMINAAGGQHGTKYTDKAFFTCGLTLRDVWDNRKEVEPRLHGTLQDAHAAFLPYHGWGGFMSYEVVTDLRWTNYLLDASDTGTWAYAGPGAVRGLNRLHGRPTDKALRPSLALQEMQDILQVLKNVWVHSPELEMREVEHSLCEFDKYERVRLGEGAPRSKYNGAA